MSGVVLLNENDINRLPKDFLARIEECGVKAELSKTPCDIESGFILKCGDIEENMDFSAILSEKRDAIEDFINQELLRHRRNMMALSYEFSIGSVRAKEKICLQTATLSICSVVKM